MGVERRIGCKTDPAEWVRCRFAENVAQPSELGAKDESGKAVGTAVEDNLNLDSYIFEQHEGANVCRLHVLQFAIKIVFCATQGIVAGGLLVFLFSSFSFFDSCQRARARAAQWSAYWVLD